MSEISEEKWKRDLTSILEDLSSAQYIKMKECLRGFPRVLKDGQSREEMPGQIIEFYGKEKSILEIERVMEQIPKRNDLVQSLLKPYVQKVRSKPEKQQHEMKRRREKEPEEGTSPAADQLERSQPVKKLKTRDSQDRKSPWRKSIFDLKSSGILETEAIVGKVVKKSELLTSKIKTFFFFLGVADEAASVKLMVYGEDHHRQIKEGRSYIFSNLIKDGIYVKVNASSSVSVTKPVIVPEEFEREAERLLSPESPLTSIKYIKSSRPQTHVSVKGTVTEIYPVKKVKVQHKEKKTNQQKFKLSQEDEEITITMWDEATEQSKDLSVGDVLLLNNMKPNEYCGKVSLNSTTFTKITKVQSVGIRKVTQDYRDQESHVEGDWRWI
ncbi:uncharacterized protein LOC117469627 isoform X2 [Trematomus bernacchii]|uniref:uncharacterized protein LOC117469627 isoform X2 n=1 Tax=Trematomus bernacchii TaxID=40690 RepID=UPI00146F1883|nr:uncharacterized protein LOC117469627 isoform X2 [Trematomus bernacchii]